MGELAESEFMLSSVFGMPETEPGMNQVTASSAVELAHYGLAVCAAKQNKLTELHQHLSAAERFGPRAEYAILREHFVKVVSGNGNLG